VSYNGKFLRFTDDDARPDAPAPKLAQVESWVWCGLAFVIFYIPDLLRSSSVTDAAAGDTNRDGRRPADPR